MMTRLKSPTEIISMRRGGKILGEILSKLSAMVAPGVTTMDLEREAEKLFAHYQVKPAFKGYRAYPAILCTSVNEEVVHGIPNEAPLEEGDLLSIDCGVILDGLYTDSAIAVTVGEKVDPAIEKFKNVCIRALWAGIKAVKPGKHIGDIGHAIEQVVRPHGYSIVKDLTGHGIGDHLHEEPYVYNYGKPGQGLLLKPGMTLAIEPILTMGKPYIETLDDDWTIVSRDGSYGVQHEHTILVTETGVEVLTLREGEVGMW